MPQAQPTDGLTSQKQLEPGIAPIRLERMILCIIWLGYKSGRIFRRH